MANILAIIGPPGAGKRSVAKAILERVARAKIITSLSTYRRRDGDIDGQHRFISALELSGLKAEDALVCTHWYAGCLIGTTKKEINAVIARSPDEPGIIVVSVDEAKDLKKHLSRRTNMVGIFSCVFLTPPLPLIHRLRLEKRGDSPERIEEALIDAKDAEAVARKTSPDFLFISNSGALRHTVDAVMNYHSFLREHVSGAP